jgi:hypothetical protein
MPWYKIENFAANSLILDALQMNVRVRTKSGRIVEVDVAI